jgi:hypothetical protein
MKRRLEIKQLIEELGLWNINQTALSTKYGVTQQMISKDIHNIVQGMPKESLTEIKFNLKTAYKKGLREMQTILATSRNNMEKTRAAQVIGNLGKQYTEMLENYGLKDRIADKLEVQGQLSIIEQVKNWLKPENSIKTGSSQTSSTPPTPNKENSTKAPQGSASSVADEDGAKH